MRKVRSSGKAPATMSLISRLDGRSKPSGFSSPMRTFAPASPAAASPLIVGPNSQGAVDRKIASPPEMSSSLAASGSKLGRVGGVERLVMEPFEEARERAVAVPPLGQELLERLGREFAELGVALLRSRGAGDRQPRGEQPVGVERVERRQQHALRKIARRPETAAAFRPAESWRADSPRGCVPDRHEAAAKIKPLHCNIANAASNTSVTPAEVPGVHREARAGQGA